MLQLMDFYSASGMSLLWCVFFQTAAVMYCFGGNKFYDCIEQVGIAKIISNPSS